MGRKNGAINQETMRIRMSSDLLKRIQDTKIPAGWGEEADSSFARHLLILGIDETERTIEERQKRAVFEDKKGKRVLPEDHASTG
jgi:hypothetical protein